MYLLNYIFGERNRIRLDPNRLSRVQCDSMFDKFSASRVFRKDLCKFFDQTNHLISLKRIEFG